MCNKKLHKQIICSAEWWVVLDAQASCKLACKDINIPFELNIFRILLFSWLFHIKNTKTFNLLLWNLTIPRHAPKRVENFPPFRRPSFNIFLIGSHTTLSLNILMERRSPFLRRKAAHTTTLLLYAKQYINQQRSSEICHLPFPICNFI